MSTTNPSRLRTPHGDVPLPAFLPDATRGAVRGLDARDLEACGVPALVVNAFHLSQRPGARTVAGLGGIHALMDWRRPVLSDSGGFQIFSLIRQNPRLGTLTSKEAIFRAAQGQKTRHLSPEKSIQSQLRLGADVLVCLDDCTHPSDPPAEQRASVDRTVAWARRCRDEFDRALDRRQGDGPRPLLFAVVQGGADLELRTRCAEALLEIGFDGYAYGGWPFDADGRLLTEVLSHTATLMPPDKPKHALGIGNPDALIACARMGYSLFDCALPTRDARRGRLYVFAAATGLGHARLYILDDVHRRDKAPLSDHCDCLACTHYSRAYLHHLFAIRDPLAGRLATIHNLRFYTALLDRLTQTGANHPPSPPGRGLG